MYSSRLYKLRVFGSGKVKAEKLVEKQSVAKKYNNVYTCPGKWKYNQARIAIRELSLGSVRQHKVCRCHKRKASNYYALI